MASSLRALLLVPVLLAAASGCDFHGEPLIIQPEVDETSSFEAGMDGWIPLGIDLTDPPVAWEVARSSDRARDGSSSVRLRLDNLNDQGKIFVEKKYALAEDQLYTVEISFDFATADWGNVNLWRILAGASPLSPTVTRTTNPQDGTGNGLTADGGYRWLTKSYTMEARANAEGELRVHVGVWGTSEFPRTYYVDNLRVTLTRKGLSAQK